MDEKKTLKQIDIRIIPLALLLNTFCYLERINLSNVHDILVQNLSLEEWQYSFAVSVFFVTYILLEVPCNMILQRVKPSN